ncbi:MAG: hypothetical protein CSB24_04980 [Deltaproteobacteria bacterium]|nr:MAG: hypothetical protein CSB24_04980 [Deltaproteobacteria bacterium]
MPFAFLFMPVFLSANEITKEEANAFFERYVDLSNKFDESVVELYADDAIIRATRIYPNAQIKKMELDGIKWKSLVKQVMPLAKAKGDINKFSKIQIKTNGKRAKIKAARYSVIKCYTDKNYYMIVEKDKQGIFRIIEEYMETKPQSNCP